MIFADAVTEGERKATPCERIKLPEVVGAPVVPPTRDVVERVIDAMPEPYQALVFFAWLTGLRQGELFGLAADRLDFLRREVRVDQQLVYISGQDEAGEPNRPFLTPKLKTKNSYRTVPVPTVALNVMAQHMAKFPPGQAGLLFLYQATPADRADDFHGIWQYALRQAGLDPTLHFHHLRHAYVSLLIEGGESPKVVAERIGDTVAEVWNTYAHLWPTSDEKTRAILDRAVAGPASTQPKAIADSVRTGKYPQAADQGK